MQWYIGAIIGAAGTIGLATWGYLLSVLIRRIKGMTFNIPDLNASALINGFKDPGVLLALANMMFVIITQALKWNISIADYMAVATPVIAVITGKTVSTIASYRTGSTTNNSTNTTSGGPTT